MDIDCVDLDGITVTLYDCGGQVSKSIGVFQSLPSCFFFMTCALLSPVGSYPHLTDIHCMLVECEYRWTNEKSLFLSGSVMYFIS